MKFPEQFRASKVPHGYESSPGDGFGVFVIPRALGRGDNLKIIANDGSETGWDHVSVSIFDKANKTPSWEQMRFVKSLFWESSECVVEFHPPEAQYVNTHAGCLHLWRWVRGEFPMPPTICV